MLVEFRLNGAADHNLLSSGDNGKNLRPQRGSAVICPDLQHDRGQRTPSEQRTGAITYTGAATEPSHPPLLFQKSCWSTQHHIEILPADSIARFPLQQTKILLKITQIPAHTSSSKHKGHVSLQILSQFSPHL